MHNCSRPLRRAFALLLMFAAPAAFAQATLPTDFVDAPVVSGLSEPANLCFLPDGRLLLVEQHAALVRLVVNGAIAAPDPVLAVPNVRTDSGERGLLGVAVDPGWPARPYVYLYYDYSLTATNRLARFTATGDLAFAGTGGITLDPASRYDVLTTLPDNANNHNGGTVRFGTDGMLYLALGDDAIGCNAQNKAVLAGKILRLDVRSLPPGPGGPAPRALLTAAGNPFAASPDSNTRLVWAYGLRNPYDFHVDAATGELFVADVGESEYEELDRVTTGGLNFGWPFWEGPVRHTVSCAVVDSSGGFVPPIYWHPHNTSGSAAVMGGLVYHRPPGATTPFPIAYEGDVFVSDVYEGFLRRLKRSGSTWSVAPAPGQPDPADWALQFTYVPDYEIGPDGAIWYSKLWTNYPQPDGQVRRIVSTSPLAVELPAPGAAGLALAQPWPSPAHGEARIAFALDRARFVRLTVLDLAGRRVRALVGGELLSPGPHEQRWDGRDDGGAPVPAGIYLVRLESAGADVSRRLAWLR